MDFINPKDVPPEVWARLRDHETYMDVGASRLVRVLAIGQAVDMSDVRVELIALEVRETGAFLHWKAYPSHDRMLGEIEAVVSDEVGTQYRTFPSGYGGGGREWKGELTVTPAPPVDVSKVRVHVRGFAGFGGGFPAPVQTPVEGDWEFEFGTESS